ncbi:hypothetical protein Sango_3063000 [Sesamum angolense]|uniref:Uncharacterized protein n=1 Tax=Sesamum angolense TaxID=2727404 RepID=A0AAE1VZ04_9LAMI|nr:hypothetical protein Sango_3063000 [Sesamum angolense]
MNVVALGILVITIVVNVWIQSFQLRSFGQVYQFRQQFHGSNNFDASFACYISFFSNHASNQQKEFGVEVPRDAQVQTIGSGGGHHCTFMQMVYCCQIQVLDDLSCNYIREELKIEAHWTQSLVNWRIVSQQAISPHSCLTCSSISLVLQEIQGTMLSKLMTSNNDMESESKGDAKLNLSRFTLLLDGEAELPKKTLEYIIRQADKVIEMGEKRQPQNLIHLLNIYSNFRGVREFDSHQVPSLLLQEPPNCWSLPLVALTSIAISLPNVANNKVTQLVSSVNEGLSLVKLIEKTLYESDELVNIRNAAEVSWFGVTLYRKWQGMDLRKISLKCKNSKNVLQEFSDNAERTIAKFKRRTSDFLMENPLNWSANMIAANSMYRISKTILLSCQKEMSKNDEGLFQRLSVMIADILAACFTKFSTCDNYQVPPECHRKRERERPRGVSPSW